MPKSVRKALINAGIIGFLGFAFVEVLFLAAWLGNPGVLLVGSVFWVMLVTFVVSMWSDKG